MSVLGGTVKDGTGLCMGQAKEYVDQQAQLNAPLSPAEQNRNRLVMFVPND
jgi:hypothetical protein